jgi:hydrogenase expression/formation protein HypC
MCLAVPSKVLSKDEDNFAIEVDIMGNTKTVSALLAPEVEVGDWVLVHAGQVISIISDEEAQGTLALWEEMLNDDN